MFKGMFAASKFAEVYLAAGIFIPLALFCWLGVKKAVSTQEAIPATRMKTPFSVEAEVRFVRSEGLILNCAWK